jgi:preprotein translocase subunit Sec61beta
VGDARTGRRTRLLPTMVVVVGAVVAGVILLGAIAGFI